MNATLLALLPPLALAACCCRPPACAPPCRAPRTVQATPPPAASPAPAAATASDVERALAQRRVKSLDWHELDLDAALAHLRTVSGHEFVVSPTACAERFDDVVITAQLDDLSVADILEYVLTEPWGLRWEVREGVVWILTEGEVEDSVRLRYYDVTDLVPRTTLFTPGEDPPPQDLHAVRDLEEAIQREVHPAWWGEARAALEIRYGILIVRAPEAVREEIDALLKAERTKRSAPGLSPELEQAFDAVTVSLSARDTTVGALLETLRMQTGHDLALDPRSAARVKDSPVPSLELRDVSLSIALRMVAAAAGEPYVWCSQGRRAVLARRDDVR